MEYIKITNLRQNPIIYKDLNKQNKLDMLKCALCFCFLIVTTAFLIVTKTDNGVVDIASSTFSPIMQLYNDDSNIAFTNSALAEVKNSELKMVLPIKSTKYDIVSQGIDFEVDSTIMIFAPEGGVVEDIGNNSNGQKYITIRHTTSIVSTITNIDILGVKIGELVSKGKNIATAVMGEKIHFEVMQNGVNVTGLKVEKSSIKWD